MVGGGAHGVAALSTGIDVDLGGRRRGAQVGAWRGRGGDRRRGLDRHAARDDQCRGRCGDRGRGCRRRAMEDGCRDRPSPEGPADHEDDGEKQDGRDRSQGPLQPDWHLSTLFFRA